MTNRAIPCPECGGTGRYTNDPMFDRGRKCPECIGACTIPDRRSPTAAEIELDELRDLVGRLLGEPVMKALLAVLEVQRIREEEGR